MSEWSPMEDIRAGVERRDAQDGAMVRWVTWFCEVCVGVGGMDLQVWSRILKATWTGK